MRVDQPAGFVTHQLGRLDLDAGLGNRELHTPVLACGAAEHNALLDLGADLVDEPVAIADALGGDQRAFGIQSVEDVLEALPSAPNRFAAGI